MPTYQNRSGQQISVGDFTFSGGEKKPIHQKYLEIADYPTIVKISEDPFIDNTFITVFTDIGSSSSLKMSRQFNFQHSTILKVVDGSSQPNDGEIVEICCFAGITDNVRDSMIIKRIKFTRHIGYDEFGGQFSFWEPDSFPKIIQQQIDVYSELTSYLVSIPPASGSINLMIKYY